MPTHSLTMPAFLTSVSISVSSNFTPTPRTDSKPFTHSFSVPTYRHSHVGMATSASLSRVAIVGGGISGLSTALALCHSGVACADDIDIYETRSGPDTALGGALNLSGASSILYHVYGIDMRAHGTPFKRVIARTTTSRAFFTSTLFDVDVDEAVKQHDIKSGLVDESGDSLLVTVMRDELQRVLLQNVVIKNGVTIHRNCKVSNIEPDGILCFQNESSVNQKQYDLIIGADGVRSIVRNSMFSEFQQRREYTGFRLLWGVGGSLDMTRDETHHKDARELPFGCIHQWFGDGVYVMRYAAGTKNSREQVVVISYRDIRATDENESYRSSNESKISVREEGLDVMKRAGIPNDVCLAFESSARFIDTSVYECPNVPTWHSNKYRTVLVGDAAHAMAPYLGQGANQAVQDAYVLACALSTMKTDRETERNVSVKSLDEALTTYEKVRRTPTQALIKSSRFVGLLETQRAPLGTLFRDCAFLFAGTSGLVSQSFINACIPRIGNYSFSTNRN